MSRDVPSAHDATQTHDCKTVGCDGTARANRGRYAYLCDHCKTVAQRRHETAPPPAPPEPPAPPAAEEPPPAPLLEAAIDELAGHAKNLEDAIAARQLAREQAAAAVEAFNTGLQIVQAARALLGVQPRGDET